jgi:hypothetical protein
MARRTSKKRIKMGYALFIPDRNGAPGKYERVGFLFGTSLEASQWRERHYPNVTKWSVQGVRVNCEPVSPAEETNIRR